MIQWICEKLTNHKYNKLIAWTEHTETCPPDCKTEYYYECKICKIVFWNYEPLKHRKKSKIRGD